MRDMERTIHSHRARTEARLRDVGVQIVRDIEHTIAALDDDNHINSLGVLQGFGSEFDRLAGIREELVELQNIERSIAVGISR